MIVVVENVMLLEEMVAEREQHSSRNALVIEHLRSHLANLADKQRLHICQSST